MKKRMGIVLVLLVAVLFNMKTVHAKEIVFTNENGVTFTQEEYDFIGEMYWDGFQRYITQEVKDWYSEEDYENAKIEKTGLCQKVQEPNRENGTYYSTPYKEITTSKSCGLLCKVQTTAHWFAEPSVKSHDVMGSLLFGPTRVTTPATFVVGDGVSHGADAIVYDTDGFGAVFELPDAEEISITQTFVYSGTGIVFTSYQHAASSISLAHAQEFTINIAGYGSVFAFYGNAFGVYDGMPGVQISV